MYCLMLKVIPKEKNVLYVDSWNVIPAQIEDIETARVEKAKLIKYLKASKQMEPYRYKVEIATMCDL